MRTPVLLAALVLALQAPPSWAEEDPDWRIWSDRRFTDEEIRASKELSRIQGRIDQGDLPKVQFDFDSSEIRPESYPTLNLIADLILKRPSLKLRISAHTCTMGSFEYNMKLSERRAKSVKEYLVKQGAYPPSIRYRGYGYTQPVADNSTEEGREKNRRVEFRIVKRDWDSVY